MEKPDIVSITETWLYEDICESESYIIGYKCVRCDRNRHGGGVALFISEKLEFQVTMCGPKELEFLLVSVYNVNNANERVYVGLWYRPPDNMAVLDDLYSILESLYISVFSSFVLLGDFNINFYNQQHPLFCKLSTILHNFVLKQVITQPTHFSSSGNSSLIDLVLLSVPSQLAHCRVIPPLSNSDHNGVDLTLKWSRHQRPVKARKRTIWRYAHADFDKANNLLGMTDWTFLLNQPNIDTAWDMWKQKFMSIMEECIPKATIKQRRNLPWMNRCIKAKIMKRNNIYRKARSTNDPTLWSRYTSLRNEVVQLLRQSKKGHLKKMSKLGSKQFWKTIKFLGKTSSQIPNLKTDSKEASTTADKVSMLSEVFSKNFNSDLPPLSESDCQQFTVDPSSPPPESIESILCTQQFVSNLLNGLDTSKASGPDGISGYMLKGTAQSIASSLTMLFNMSIISGSPQNVESVLCCPNS